MFGPAFFLCVLIKLNFARICKSSQGFWSTTGRGLIPPRPPLKPRGLHFYTFEGFSVAAKFSSGRRNTKRRAALHEAKMLHQLKGLPNVVQMFFCVQDENYIAVFTEHLKIDLEGGLSAFQRLSWAARLNLLLGPTRVLKSMHGRGYVHGDLKPPNLMVAANGHSLKLIDFNCSVRFGGKVHGYTKFYAAPEILARDARAWPSQDAWGWTVTIVDLLLPELRAKLKTVRWKGSKKVFGPLHVSVVKSALRQASKLYALPLEKVIGRWLRLKPSDRPTMASIERSLLNLLRAARS